MTEREADELRFLRHHYGISASQAWGEIPLWELDLLGDVDGDE